MQECTGTDQLIISLNCVLLSVRFRVVHDSLILMQKKHIGQPFLGWLCGSFLGGAFCNAPIFFLIICKQNRSIQKTMAFYNKLIIKAKGEAYEKSSIDCRLRSRCACRCAFDLEARASAHWLHAPTYLGIFGCAAVRKATRNMFITNRRLLL